MSEIEYKLELKLCSQNGLKTKLQLICERIISELL